MAERLRALTFDLDADSLASLREALPGWEIDATFYVLKALSRAGVVWDLKMPPAAVRLNEHRLGSRVIERAAAQLAARFN